MKILIAIGINKYNDVTYQTSSLNSAVRDAYQISGMFEHRLGFDEVHTLTAGDQQNGELMKFISTTFKKLRPNDLFVFYFSGLSVAKTRVLSSGERKVIDQLFMLPNAHIIWAQDDLATYGTLSLSDLTYFTDKEGVQRLFILDTSRVPLLQQESESNSENSIHSKGEELFYRDISARKITSLKSNINPPTILFACKNGNNAREIYPLGRGLFTVSLQKTIEQVLDLQRPVIINEMMVKNIKNAMRTLSEKNKCSYGGQNDHNNEMQIPVWTGGDINLFSQQEEMRIGSLAGPFYTTTNEQKPGLMGHEIALKIEADLQHGSAVELEHNDGGSLTSTTIANQIEYSARNLLVAGNYGAAWAKLIEATAIDPIRLERIHKEFEFAYTFDGELGGAYPCIKQQDKAWNWRRKIWMFIAEGNNPLLDYEPAAALEIEENNQTDAVETNDNTAVVSKKENSASPSAKGDHLELVVVQLFNTFFSLGDENLIEIRRQKRGTQHGYDISIEWRSKHAAPSSSSMLIYIECKNYRDDIGNDQVSGILSQDAYAPTPISHWILISPHSEPNNELVRFFHLEKARPTKPFNIQIWTPNTGVKELFGLDHSAYDQLYSHNPEIDGPHPRTWTDAKRHLIRQKWMDKLAPPFRLAQCWGDYLDCLTNPWGKVESFDSFGDQAKEYVRLNCRNSAGILLEKPLDYYIDEWLADESKPTLFILGDYGDGKTCFTQMLAKHWAEKWQKDRNDCWFPLWLKFNPFPKDANEFLIQRLKAFDATMGQWNTICGANKKRLVILDGFDEISGNIGPEAMKQNFQNLITCYDLFAGCKVLISSRPHIFETPQILQRKLKYIGNPTMYYLAPISRRDSLNSLEQYLLRNFTSEEVKQRIAKVDSMNDPVGLARKPLYLNMLKVVLTTTNVPALLDVDTLYDKYINDSLERKKRLLADDDYASDPDDHISGMRKILGKVAELLQRTPDCSHVSLNQLQTDGVDGYAKLLWDFSDPNLDDDAKARVGVRSLLGRVGYGVTTENEWLVDFCHRSMREYFVAIRLCEEIANSTAACEKFLDGIILNFEIIQFAAARIQKSGTTLACTRLCEIIERNSISHAKNKGSICGYALTLLYQINKALPRDINFRGKNFAKADLEGADLSHMDFSGSSFIGANLSNVKFEGANFSFCKFDDVSFEETKPVIAIAANRAGEELVALYGDGGLRVWQIHSGRKKDSQVVGEAKVEIATVMGIHETDQVWLRSGRSWSFFSRSKEPWVTEGSFRINSAWDTVRVQQERLLLSRRIDNEQMELILVDLEQKATIAKKIIAPTQWCAALGAEAFLWRVEIGFQIESIVHANANESCFLRMPTSPNPMEPTCLDVWPGASGAYIVASGTGDGRILVWQVTLVANHWQSQKILERKTHDGPVTTVAMVDESRIASGGEDRTIALTRILGAANMEGIAEDPLQRNISCKGMKIDGLTGPAEYALLKQYIASSEGQES